MNTRNDEDFTKVGDLSIDRVSCQVTLKDKPIGLTKKEFHLLCVLSSEPEKLFRRKELLAQVWGPGITVEPRMVDAYVARLRKILANEIPLSSSVSIETVWGMGYRLRIIPVPTISQ